MTAHIELENVCKHLGDRQVLNGITFSIPKGKILAVIGHSGSGKSTLLRALNRLTEIDSGRIMISGRSIKKYDPVMLRRKVGLVSQIPSMFEGKVYHNLRYGLDLQNRTGNAKILEALTDAELNRSFLYRDASRLSVGEQQRVAIARAITLQPEILLLDEPTSALDSKITRRFEDTICRLKESRNITIIWVTHDPRQARRIGDIIAVLRTGRLVKVGPPDLVFLKGDKHKNTEVSQNRSRGGIK